MAKTNFFRVRQSGPGSRIIGVDVKLASVFGRDGKSWGRSEDGEERPLYFVS